MKKATLNDSYCVEAFEMVIKLYDKYVDPNDRSVGTAESIDNFVKGRAAMMIQGQQKIADFYVIMSSSRTAGCALRKLTSW
jgi:ABC-type glycerol-3-phosphate transport system substrate-binding protein